MSNQIAGYSLFNEVEDKELQARNRATTMANIAEDGKQGDVVTPSAFKHLILYYQKIPLEERGNVFTLFQQVLRERGFDIKFTKTTEH